MNGRTLKKNEIVHGLLGPIVFKHFIRATIWLDALHKLGRRLIKFAWLQMMDDEKGSARGLLTLPISGLLTSHLLQAGSFCSFGFGSIFLLNQFYLVGFIFIVCSTFQNVDEVFFSEVSKNFFWQSAFSLFPTRERKILEFCFIFHSILLELKKIALVYDSGQIKAFTTSICSKHLQFFIRSQT